MSPVAREDACEKNVRVALTFLRQGCIFVLVLLRHVPCMGPGYFFLTASAHFTSLAVYTLYKARNGKEGMAGYSFLMDLIKN